MRAKWNTYIRFDDADETPQRLEQARGRVLAAPFDVPVAGRMAECAHPSGAEFRIR
jgi:predicted enzyme related to lactoylglutathione lyase